MYLIILVITYYILNLIIFTIIHKGKTKKQYRHNDVGVSFISNNNNMYKPLLSDDTIDSHNEYGF